MGHGATVLAAHGAAITPPKFERFHKQELL